MTIGFDPDVYSVNEEDGTVSLTIRVLAGQLARTVSVNFFTQDGTATSTAPIDFIAVPPAIPITLQFSPTDLNLTATVTISNDDISEDSEQFDGLLFSNDPAVILAPSNASVEIRDRDRKLTILILLAYYYCAIFLAAVTIGFDPTEYAVNEADGSVTLRVRILDGVLEREVVVDFETTPGSATSSGNLKKPKIILYQQTSYNVCLAPADYEMTVSQLTFSPTMDVDTVAVTIFNDAIHEDNETFIGNLPIASADPQTILNPSTAVVTIIDDIDRKLFQWQCLCQIMLHCFLICSYYNWI